jgi:hypothetical protein
VSAVHVCRSWRCVATHEPTLIRTRRGTPPLSSPSPKGKSYSVVILFVIFFLENMILIVRGLSDLVLYLIICYSLAIGNSHGSGISLTCCTVETILQMFIGVMHLFSSVTDVYPTRFMSCNSICSLGRVTEQLPLRIAIESTTLTVEDSVRVKGSPLVIGLKVMLTFVKYSANLCMHRATLSKLFNLCIGFQLNKVLLPNPFDRPRSVFLRQLNGSHGMLIFQI